jgi:hypothetical protein
MIRASGWGGALWEYIATDIQVKCVAFGCGSSRSLERAGTLIPAHHEGSSSPLCLLEPTTCSKPVQHSLLPISGRRPRETDGRARNRRAERFRVNALASRLGRSRFAACVLRFLARGWVRGGLSRCAGGVAWPRCWPTVAGVLADYLSVHRETARPERSLVHSSRGRHARTHEQSRRSAQNPDGAEHGSLG